MQLQLAAHTYCFSKHASQPTTIKASRQHIDHSVAHSNDQSAVYVVLHTCAGTLGAIHSAYQSRNDDANMLTTEAEVSPRHLCGRLRIHDVMLVSAAGGRQPRSEAWCGVMV
jgi:hypothetical protein